MSPSNDVLLTTKLHRPGDDPVWVARPRLLAQLDRGLRCQRILVSAPSGFGKTTLVGQWLLQLEQSELRTAWLSLDEGDNRLSQFLRYLAAAVRGALPDACPTTRALLAAPELPQTTYLADVLASELAALPAPLVLVLDDYHLITAPEVHALVEHLLRYPPPPLHLVILTRADPPLHLARLRVQRSLAELRAGDLRFDSEETGAFLSRQLGHPLNSDLAQALQTRTEGWAGGLQLAGIALQHEDPHRFLARFHGGDRLLSAYLLEEVLGQLPPALMVFVLRTALLERFCGPLAERLLDAGSPPGSGQAMLDELVSRNLFLAPLDDTGTWYRYHDLFHDFLHAQLYRHGDAALVPELHRRAGAWLAAAGLIDEALRHLLAAGELDAAADLVGQQLHRMLDHAVEHTALIGWLAQFPATSLESHPDLLLAQAWQLAFRFDLAALAALLARLDALLAAEPAEPAERHRLRQADRDYLHGYVAYWRGDFPRAHAVLRHAYACMPETRALAHAHVVLHLALATAQLGQPDPARVLLRDALAASEARQRPTQLILLGALAILELTAANLSAATQTLGRLLAVADEWLAESAWQEVGIVATWHAWAHCFLGQVAYERNDLAAARSHWEQLAARRYLASPRAAHEALVGLALVAQARGEGEAAAASAEMARAFAVETRNPLAMAVSAALETRLALLAGRQAEAVRRSEELPTTISVGPAAVQELPPVTRLRALLADGAPASLTAALRLARSCLAQAEEAHNTRQIIALLALQSLVLQAARRPDEAAHTLGRALALGERAGFTRTFLDLGLPMAELLRAYAAGHSRAAYARRLLAAFAGESGHAPAPTLPDVTPVPAEVMPLTPRELELLVLIDQRLTIQEIAERLVISTNTVKRHTSNIYAKLGAGNRREACARARDLGLVPPR
jgi:LuxR family maltose regulon positive regulatory protein